MPLLDGGSRFDGFAHEDDRTEFRARAVDGRLPPWPDQLLARLIPDENTRARFASELGPVPLALYEEHIPAVPGWPDAPCHYIQLSGAYGPDAEAATDRGWTVQHLPGNHFQMLVDPVAVGRIIGALGSG